MDKAKPKQTTEADPFLTELRKLEHLVAASEAAYVTHKENAAAAKEELTQRMRDLRELIVNGTPGLFEGDED